MSLEVRGFPHVFYNKNNEIYFFRVPGVEVESKNRSKFEQKMRSTCWHRCSIYLSGFWEAHQLGTKMEQKSIKKGIENMMEKMYLEGF